MCFSLFVLDSVVWFLYVLINTLDSFLHAFSILTRHCFNNVLKYFVGLLTLFNKYAWKINLKVLVQSNVIKRET